MEGGWRIALLEFAQMSIEIETRKYTVRSNLYYFWDWYLENEYK